MSTTYTVCTRVTVCMLYTHTHLTALCPGLPGWAGTRKVRPIWILLKQETVGGSGINWAICKSAPRSRQTTTPAPHHCLFFLQAGCPSCRPTNSVKALFACYNGGIFYCSLRAGCVMMPHHRPLHSRDSGHIFSLGIESPSVTWCRIENRQVYDYLIVFKKS